jgi:hypothetical protein
MTREQDLERQLAEWLVDGPSTAPAEVVDAALRLTAGRPQERGVRRLLAHLGRWFQISRIARVSALAAVLAGILLTSVIISAPFLGSSPKLDRWIDIETGDPRMDGRAHQVLTVLFKAEKEHQLRGTMHLDNEGGAWDGTVDIVHYPSGEEYEYASLTGSGSYEGLTYLYVVRPATAEAERTVEGAIWPGEPPPLLDPSVLP